jgi:ribosomal protein L23
MDLTQVIVGPLVTEKAERGKTAHTYTMQVAALATKVDVKKAMKRFWDIDVKHVRMMWIRPKHRMMQGGRMMQKRAAIKKAIVSLPEGSRALDLASFRAS